MAKPILAGIAAVLLLTSAAPSLAGSATAKPDSATPFRALDFGVNLDLFTITGSADGGMVNHFAVVDFLVLWPRFERWNPYVGIGMGLLAPRVRAGVDIYPLGRPGSGPALKVGGRYVLVTWIDPPDTFQNFDSEHDFARGPMAEAGVGYRWDRPGVDFLVTAVYLVGPMYPVAGMEEERSYGQIEPTGSAVFHGGTLSLGIEW